MITLNIIYLLINLEMNIKKYRNNLFYRLKRINKILKLKKKKKLKDKKYI
jgi:hypothetical protein